MATTPKTRLWIWVTALALVMACVPSLTTQSIPTTDPGAINTFIAQTARAAATQTAALLPSATLTPTVVPTRNTDTPTPTATSTVIFLFFSPTPLVAPTVTKAGSSSDSYACQVMSVSPLTGTSFNARQDFEAFWTVRNIGKKKWERTTVTHVYSAGDMLHKVSSYSLDKSVPSGGTVDLGVSMQAPKNPGSYTTMWSLYTGSKFFCEMTLSIVVRVPATVTTTTTAAP